MASRRVVEMGNPPSRVVEYRPSGLRDESKAWVVFAWEQPQVGQGHGRVAGFREYGPIGWKLGNWFFWAGKDPAIVSKIAKHYDAKVEREWGFNERDFHVPFRDSFWGHLKARTQLNFVKSDGSAYDSAWTFQRNGPKWIQSMGEGNLYQPQQFSREVIWMERSRDALNTLQVAMDEAIEIAERENQNRFRHPLTKVKTLKSHAAVGRWLQDVDDVGWIPRRADVSSPYSYSPTHKVYRKVGVGRHIVVETRHRTYDVFELSSSEKVYATEEEAENALKGLGAAKPRPSGKVAVTPPEDVEIPATDPEVIAEHRKRGRSMQRTPGQQRRAQRQVEEAVEQSPTTPPPHPGPYSTRRDWLRERGLGGVMKFREATPREYDHLATAIARHLQAGTSPVEVAILTQSLVQSERRYDPDRLRGLVIQDIENWAFNHGERGGMVRIGRAAPQRIADLVEAVFEELPKGVLGGVVEDAILPSMIVAPGLAAGIALVAVGVLTGKKVK